MPKPRKALVLSKATSYYHNVSRRTCRAFLCGVDSHGGKSYEQWYRGIADRKKLLADIFAVYIFTYAAMPNHCEPILPRVQGYDGRARQAIASTCTAGNRWLHSAASVAVSAPAVVRDAWRKAPHSWSMR